MTESTVALQAHKLSMASVKVLVLTALSNASFRAVKTAPAVA